MGLERARQLLLVREVGKDQLEASASGDREEVLMDPVDAVLPAAEHDQARRREPEDLPAQLGPDRAAGAGHDDPLADEPGRDLASRGRRAPEWDRSVERVKTGKPAALIERYFRIGEDLDVAREARQDARRRGEEEDERRVRADREPRRGSSGVRECGDRPRDGRAERGPTQERLQALEVGVPPHRAVRPEEVKARELQGNDERQRFDERSAGDRSPTTPGGRDDDGPVGEREQEGVAGELRGDRDSSGGGSRKSGHCPPPAAALLRSVTGIGGSTASGMPIPSVDSQTAPDASSPKAAYA